MLGTASTMAATKTKCRKKTAAAACTKKKVAKKNCPKPAKKRKPTKACSKPKKKTRRTCTPCIMVNPDYLAHQDDYFPHADVTFADEVEEKTDEIYRDTFPSTEERKNMPEAVPETVPREKVVWAKPVEVAETVQKSPPGARKQVHPEFIPDAETVQTPLPGARKQVDSETSLEDLLVLRLEHLESKLDELDEMSARKNSEIDDLEEKAMQKHLDDLLDRAISSKQKNIDSMLAGLQKLVGEMDPEETDPVKLEVLAALTAKAEEAKLTFASELLAFSVVQMGAIVSDYREYKRDITSPASFDDLPDKEADESIPNPTEALDSKQSRADTEVSVEDSYDDVDSEDDNEDEGDEGSVYSDDFEKEDPATSPTTAERDQNKGDSGPATSPTSAESDQNKGESGPSLPHGISRQGISSDSDLVLRDKENLLSSGMMGKLMGVLTGISMVETSTGIYPHPLIRGFIVVEDIKDCKMSEVDYDTRADVSTCGIEFRKTEKSTSIAPLLPLVHEIQRFDGKTRVGFVIFDKEKANKFGLEAHERFIMNPNNPHVDPEGVLHLVFIDADKPNTISMLSKYGRTLLKTTNVSTDEPFNVTAFADTHWR